MDQQSEIKLSVNSWHAKLIKWVFGFDPKDFNNLCPYFWLLIASLLLVIPVTPFKLILRVLSLIGKKIKISKKRNINKSFEQFINNLSKGEIFYILCGGSDKSLHTLRMQANYWTYSAIFHQQLKAKLLIVAGGDRVERDDLWQRMTKIIIKKYAVNESWKSWLKEFDEEACQLKKTLDELELARREERRRKSKAIKDIMTATKVTVKTLITILILPTGYALTALLTNILAWLFTRDLTFYIELLEVLAGAVAILLIILYSIWSLKSIIEWKDNRTEKTTLEWILLIPILPLSLLLWILELVFKFIWNYFFVKLLGGINAKLQKYGEIFLEYSHASYSDYCPGINWKKEDDK